VQRALFLYILEFLYSMYVGRKKYGENDICFSVMWESRKNKAIDKKGKTFDDVVTKLLDYYEDIQREDWVNTKSGENRCKEQIKDKRLFYTTL
jgi:hypothetical protein